MGIKSVTILRFKRAGNPVAIELPRDDVGQVTVPNHIRLLGQRNAMRFLFGAGPVEQTKFDFRGVFGKDSEIHSHTIPGRPERVRTARSDFQRNLRLREEQTRENCSQLDRNVQSQVTETALFLGAL